MKPIQIKQLIKGKLIKAIFFITIKKSIFLLVLFTMALLQTNAQRSGLYISTLNNPDFSNLRGGIPATTAALRKEIARDFPINKGINQAIKKEIPVATKIEKQVATESEKQKTIEKEAPVTTDKETSEKTVKETLSKNSTIPTDLKITYTTNYTIYDMPGNTAVLQLTSLQASFKFMFINTNNIKESISNNSAGLIELYKLEKNSSIRTFCIPSGNCTSLNIPIQITLNGQPVVPNAVNASAAGAVYFVIIPSGYLQPGEYAFIDKSTLTTDGTSIQCFAFTVKQ